MFTSAINTKRRLTGLALAAFVAATLAACDSGAATTTPVAATATATIAATATTPASPTSQPSDTPLVVTATSQASPTTPPTATEVPATATQAATPTSLATATIPPTDTPTVAPTETAQPTDTAAPTNTPKPAATATRVRPTATPKPPTETPLPPTATSEPEATSTTEAAATETTEPDASSTADVTGTATPELTGTTEPTATVQPTSAATAATTAAPASASLIVQAKPGKHMVALTFDAGAGRGRVADILDTLAQYNVHITFFLTGKWAEENPDMVKAIRDGGHEIANHSYDHPYFTKITDEQMIDEIQHTESIIQGIAGVSSKPYFREPYGDYNKHVLQVVASQGFQSIYWTLDSLDSVGQPKTKDFIIKRVTENNIQMDGAIILQHMAADASADALPTEIERLQAKGLKIVTIAELLK